jgi:hypothetical protein
LEDSDFESLRGSIRDRILENDHPKSIQEVSPSGVRLYSRSKTEKKINAFENEKPTSAVNQEGFYYGNILDEEEKKIKNEVNKNDSMLSQGSNNEISQNFGYSFYNQPKKLKKNFMGSQSVQDFSKKGFAFISQNRDHEKVKHFYSKHLASLRDNHLSRITPNESILEEVGYEDGSSAHHNFLEPKKKKRKKPLLYRNKQRNRKGRVATKSPLKHSLSKSKGAKSKKRKVGSSNNSFMTPSKKKKIERPPMKKSKSKVFKKYKTKPGNSQKSRTPVKKKNKSANTRNKLQSKNTKVKKLIPLKRLDSINKGSIDKKSKIQRNKTRGKLKTSGPRLSRNLKSSKRQSFTSQKRNSASRKKSKKKTVPGKSPLKKPPKKKISKNNTPAKTKKRNKTTKKNPNK